MNAELIKNSINGISDEQTEKLIRYYEMLVDWNTRVNLTAITEPGEVATKHFADSVLPEKLLPDHAKVIDVGTGAGFPGIPLLIMRPDIDLTLLDALNKRLVFLEACLNELGLKAKLVHMRAEDAGRDDALRGKYDVALTRAVGSVGLLCELTTPLLRVGGVSLMYKGAQAVEELELAKNALAKLCLQAHITDFDAKWGRRSVIVVKKLEKTPKEFPRRMAVIKKVPL